jgi:hypothetical protein
MTGHLQDEHDGDVPASLAGLRTYDVSIRRSRELRRRCHAMLLADATAKSPTLRTERSWLQRVAVPALAGAWCFAYLVEIIRFTGAIFTDFPRP